MSAGHARWEVRVEFATRVAVSTGTSLAAQITAALTEALERIPGIDRARGFLTCHPYGTTIGATIVLEATSAGEALDTAVEAARTACAGIILGSLAEAGVKPVNVDPRS